MLLAIPSSHVFGGMLTAILTSSLIAVAAYEAALNRVDTENEHELGHEEPRNIPYQRDSSAGGRVVTVLKGAAALFALFIIMRCVHAIGIFNKVAGRSTRRLAEEECMESGDVRAAMVFVPRVE